MTTGAGFQAASVLREEGGRFFAWLFAGGLAGLAGNLQVTAVYHRLIPAISSNYGYLALLVVMLALPLIPSRSVRTTLTS